MDTVMMCEESVMIFFACFLIVEEYNSWRVGRGAAFTVRCSLFLSCFVAVPNQTVMDVRGTY